MLRAFVVFGVVAAAGCPSKQKKKNDSGEQAVAKMGEYADRMCACRANDKPCADAIQADMTRWAAEIAKTSSANQRPPSEATMRRLTEHGQRYSECMTKAMLPAPPTPDVAPPPAELPEVPTSPVTADAALRAARAFAQQNHPDLVFARARFEYVDAEGVLDPEDGEAVIEMGRASAETQRKIGAKVKPAAQPEDCFALRLAEAVWTHEPTSEPPTSCLLVKPYTPRCSVAKIWQRAMAKGAPKGALALVAVRLADGGATWSFTIEDAPRDIHIAHTFSDDCALAVEK